MKLNITLDGRRYYRSTQGRWVFGVCGGIAQHFGWKSWMVRLGLTIAAIAVPGISTVLIVMLYIALGLLVPTDNQR